MVILFSVKSRYHHIKVNCESSGTITTWTQGSNASSDPAPQCYTCGKRRVERNRLMTNRPSSSMSLHVPLLSVTWAVVMCNGTWEDGLTWPPCMNRV